MVKYNIEGCCLRDGETDCYLANDNNFRFRGLKTNPVERPYKILNRLSVIKYTNKHFLYHQHVKSIKVIQL